jgi:hypothetical protein
VVVGAAVLAFARLRRREPPEDLGVTGSGWSVRRVAPGVTIVWKYEMTLPIRE